MMNVQALPASSATGAKRGMEQCVPAAALAIPGEGEAMESPAVGDRVSYTVEGKVTRVAGDQVYVAPETINGEAVKEDAAPEAAEDPELAEAQAYQQLEQEAGQAGTLL